MAIDDNFFKNRIEETEGRAVFGVLLRVTDSCKKVMTIHIITKENNILCLNPQIVSKNCAKWSRDNKIISSNSMFDTLEHYYMALGFDWQTAGRYANNKQEIG